MNDLNCAIETYGKALQAVSVDHPDQIVQCYSTLWGIHCKSVRSIEELGRAMKQLKV